MTDATKLYKGAAALRKGIAMFAWLGDVEAALKEVPELEKTLESLRKDAKRAEGEFVLTKNALEALRGGYTGAKAQAEKIIDGANEIASAVVAGAKTKAREMDDVAQAELAKLRVTIDNEGMEHGELMAKYYTARSNVKKQDDELNAELAAIKARL